MSWYIRVLKNYAKFCGRARRREYWYFTLFNILFSLAFLTLDILSGTLHRSMGFGLLMGLYTLAVFIPGLAVFIRRLHDTGRSGWWILIAFVPLLGAITLFIFTVLDSEPGTNKYGPNPKKTSGVVGAGSPALA